MSLSFIDQSYDDMTMIDFVKQYTPQGWEEFFEQPSIEKLLSMISEKIQKDKEDGFVIYPSISNMFKIFSLVPLSKIKVVILGQDPYHNGTAHGIAFSNLSSDMNRVNPSLSNIAKEVKNCGFEMTNPNLTCWANQGVFLLNTALSVRESRAGSHSCLWYPFSVQLIKYITSHTENLVFLLFGKDAQAFEQHISPNKHHIIIKTSHPSPYSASVGNPAFLDSRCFSQCNTHLKTKINWNT